jgi:hypothetical protein
VYFAIEIHSGIMSYRTPKDIDSKAIDTEKSQKETFDEIVGHFPKRMK